MASTKIHGITIELDANTSGVSKAFSDINKQINSTASELRSVEKLLKLDPQNTTLLAQKQKLLGDAIKGNEEKLKLLAQAQESANNSDDIDKQSRSYRELQRDIESTKQKISSFNDQVDNTGTKFEEANESALSFGDVLSANILSDAIMSGLKSLASSLKSVANEMISIVSEGVEYNATMETYTTAFTAMLGDADKAQETLASIRESASKSPFDVESLVQANQALLTTGVAGDQAQKVINALGDAVAYTGGGNSELTRMASNLQQVKNVGKATAMDIRQFAMAGIDIYGILADSMGTTTEAIKDMDISYEDLEKALIKASEEGGKYYGAMSRQADTYNGQLNKLKSNWSQLEGVISEDVTNALTNDFMPSINEAIEKTVNWKENGFDSLGDALATSIIEIGESIANSDTVSSLLEAGKTLISKICEGLLEEDGNGNTAIEVAMYDLCDKLIDSFKDSNGLGNKLVQVGIEMAKGIGQSLWDNILEWFAQIDQYYADNYNGQFVTGGVWSGGFNGMNSGGFASGGISTNVTINVASQSITRETVNKWADVITERVNENLGGMI